MSVMTEAKIKHAIKQALEKIDYAMDDFKDCFPSAASKDGVYSGGRAMAGWTQSFWPGMLWVAYELSGDSKYLDAALHLMDYYEERLAAKETALVDHDIGFLYTLSTVAAYKITGDDKYKKLSLEAAQHLANRFREKGQFIQIAGEADCKDKSLYRLIIDCLMNINLLYWAGNETGDSEYTRKGFAHFNTTMETVVRSDGSTFQNFYFDQQTGERLGGGTKQGLSDTSCWSRGQAWGVTGIPFTYSYMQNKEILDKYYSITDYYLNHLPEDKIAYWDLSFTEGDEPRDSSAASIAVCGLLEACKVMPLDEEHRSRYSKAADEIMVSLIDNYSTKDDPQSNGLLKHATYYYAGGLGVDECNIWGDYFYMEALIRYAKPDWKKYW